MLRRMALLLLLACLIAPTAAFADNIDFTGLGGSWDWVCVNPDCSDLAPLHVTLDDQNLGGGVLANVNAAGFFVIPGSVMTITTGAWSGNPLENGTTVPFTFNAGGSIIVSGCGGNCFEGTFTGLSILTDSDGTVTLVGHFVGGFINPNAFGLPEGPVTGQITVTLFGNANCQPECGGQAGSADLALVTTPIPEPASLALLGTGLLGLAGRLRKKFSA